MNKESIKQAVKFCTVGIFNTLVDYVVFCIALELIELDIKLHIIGTEITIEVIIAQMMATAVAMCGSYVINKRWTFGECGKTKKRQIVKFVLTNIVAMSCTILLTLLFHDVLHLHELVNSLLGLLRISFRFDGDLGVMLCKIVASAMSFVINFIGNKFWVFKDSEAEE